MIVGTDYLAGDEAQGSLWSCYVSSSGHLHVSATGHTGSGHANIVLANNQALVCRKHRVDASGSYWCEHIETAIAHPALLENLTQTIGKSTFALQLRIKEDVFASVMFHSVTEATYSVSVAGHNENSIGLVMPEYEGLLVVREMVVNHYDEWTAASKTMCTSTQHWRATNAVFGLKDKVCLDAEKMCYPCAARTAQAMRQVDAPETQDNGFSTLPPSTPKKVPLSPFAGGNPTTVGSTRSSDGAVWDGTCWVNHGRRSDVSLPFNLGSAFASAVDEATWYEFRQHLDAKDLI